MAFTNHSYCLQVTCTFLRTIHCINRYFLSSPGHLYLFTVHPLPLQIIPIVSGSTIPFYGPSIAFTDHSYRLQVTCTFLRTIHCLYTSFLSSPNHLCLFADHAWLLQIIPIVSRSHVPFYGLSIAFTDHSYRFQVIRTFYGPSIALTDSFYRLQFTCTFLRTINCLYISFLSFPGHPYLFTDHP